MTHVSDVFSNCIEEALKVIHVICYQDFVVCVSYVVDPCAIYLDTQLVLFESFSENVFREQIEQKRG